MCPAMVELVSFGGSTHYGQHTSAVPFPGPPASAASAPLPKGSYGIQCMPKSLPGTYSEAQYYYLPCSSLWCESMSWWQNYMLFPAAAP
jgi:hypothetical protein